jgi:23S rRNA (uracil1939-C5)-methyltransferase
VIGIESSASAVTDARRNLAQFGVGHNAHVEVRAGYVERVLASLDERLDAVVLDPPRAGCGPQVIKTLIDQRIPRLVYMSCDPATLARDARLLIAGGYRLLRVQPLDMFPHTCHIETVTVWER